MSLTLNFGMGPKWTFQCSKCGKAWKERLIVGADRPLIVCPGCGDKVRLEINWN